MSWIHPSRHFLRDVRDNYSISKQQSKLIMLYVKGKKDSNYWCITPLAQPYWYRLDLRESKSNNAMLFRSSWNERRLPGQFPAPCTALFMFIRSFCLRERELFCIL